MKWLIALSLALAAGAVQAADKMSFWNQTSHDMTGVYLAPAGTDKFGPNQTLNDNDKEVSADERLAIVGVKPGAYDVRLVDKKGRVCIVRNVQVRGTGKVAFAIGEEMLTDCK